MTPWQARTLRRATRADAVYGAILWALAALALGAGHAAARYLSPDGAARASSLLDELELPRALPNAVLERDDGVPARFWDVAAAPRTIVSFYAPWCGPCQEELPLLVAQTTEHPERLAVVVGADEDPSDVRKQLDNLGLHHLRFYFDTRRELQEGGRVTALPTTFLVSRLGRVRERIVGYSQFRLQMLVFKARSDDPDPSPGE